VDESVKSLLREPGEAISGAVTGAPRVAEVMQGIRNQGYSIALARDANMAVAGNRKQASAAAQASPEDQRTADDRRFLKRLKIDC
jgi:hypothetical protein